jgi:seryl-tRNA synthetase
VTFPVDHLSTSVVLREKELFQSTSSEGRSELLEKMASLETKNEDHVAKREELLEEANRLQKKISELELRGKDLEHAGNKVLEK